MKVLIVDDNVDHGATLTKVLRLSGYDVEYSTNVLYALDFVSRWIADVVLLDIGLPHMDGYTAVRRFKERLPEARIYAVTGYGRDDDVRRSRDAGFDEHLVKPVDLETLQRITKRRAERRGSRDAGE